MNTLSRYFCLAAFFVSLNFAVGQTKDSLKDRLTLKSTETASGKVTKGHFRVFENRTTNKGRELELDIVVLHANGKSPQPDPIFYIAGGPGQAAATLYRAFQNHWMRADRDLVFVNQRGTGGSNRLAFPDWRASNPQNYLRPLFEPDRVKNAAEELGKKFDLTMYSTPMAMDDLNEIRQALGYDKINLLGGSYGTRASLVYLRRHRKSVRTATLNGVAPIEFKNPLYHAQESQIALDKIFKEVESDEEYRKAFPDLKKKFQTILDRLEKEPAQVELTDRNTGKPISIKLTKTAFCSSLRFQLYYLNTSRRVPLMILNAYEGDYKPFVISAINRNRALSRSIAAGMLLSVTAAEDVARIRSDEIEKATKNTFLGDRRVRLQIAACKLWPKSKLPKGFDAPVKSDVPTLILSGSLDPVTGPRWGEVVHKNFPNSIHLVVPGAHGVGGACIQKIQKQFLKTGQVKDLDVSCVKGMKLPRLVMPKS